MSENDHAYELRELMENFVQGFGAMGEAARKALEGLELTTQSAAEPDRFEHTDDDGDSVAVAVTPISRFVLELDTSTTAEIYLDQDAVNRLAQYLDRHRTDGPKVPVSPVRNPCEHCGHAPHGVGIGCGEGGRGMHRCACRGGA